MSNKGYFCSLLGHQAYTVGDYAEENGGWGFSLTGNYYHVNTQEKQAIRNHVSFFKPSHLFTVKFMKEVNNF